MLETFGYYVFCLVAFIVALLVLKRLTGCLVKTIILAVVITILAAIYFAFFSQ